MAIEDDKPWFEIRMGVMADNQEEVEALVDQFLSLLPYPNDALVEVSYSESLTKGRGF